MSRAFLQSASAMLVSALKRMILRAKLRALAKMPGFFRMRLASSSKATSRTWWLRFSTPQWPRMALAAIFALKGAEQA